MMEDVDRMTREGLKLHLDLLERAHVRARTPKQRRRVERKMVEVRKDLEEFERRVIEVERAEEALRFRWSGANDNGRK